jgi:L-lactate dehydrogenase (cytochrome)
MTMSDVTIEGTPAASGSKPARIGQSQPPTGPRNYGGYASVDDYREAARRRLPRAIFDFVDGGAGNEHTLRANEKAFDRYAFRPRVLTDVAEMDLGVSVLGKRCELPLFLGPSGVQRLVSKDGELDAARAAAKANSIYVLTVAASRSIEEVADAAPDGRRWFQLYLWRDHDWAEKLLERAREASYEALCVTVDIKSPGGPRYRDIRNGISRMPDSIGLRTVWDSARHLRWLSGFIRGGPIRNPHIMEGGKSGTVFNAPKAIRTRMDPSADWDEIRWLRRVWDGPLVIKGILTAEDARLAYDCGADAVICSNHGGRALDGSPATLHVLPRMVEVAQQRGKEIYFDGGIRTGGDAVKAMALGANACLIARPFWWRMTIDGERGVLDVLRILTDEMISSLVLMGRPRLADVGLESIEDLWQSGAPRD